MGRTEGVTEKMGWTEGVMDRRRKHNCFICCIALEALEHRNVSTEISVNAGTTAVAHVCSVVYRHQITELITCCCVGSILEGHSVWV